ncbi:MAG: hypothetical protein R6U13_11220 [Desulfatiglandaceae bacterium]
MTVLEVIDDSCGFHTRVIAQRKDREVVTLKISSECEEVSRWGDEITQVDWRECLGGNALESKLLRSAFKILKHRSCFVPTAVLRAVEAEVGANLPARVKMSFLPAE